MDHVCWDPDRRSALLEAGYLLRLASAGFMPWDTDRLTIAECYRLCEMLDNLDKGG